MDFLREEDIVVDFSAATKEDAFEQLTALLIRSHHLVAVDQQELLCSVLAREAKFSTCLGEGLAVPHGELPLGHDMAAVMAVSRDGLALETPDGVPVHCMVLLATPPDQRGRHLEVLAAIAQTIRDIRLRDALFAATSPSAAFAALRNTHPRS